MNVDLEILCSFILSGGFVFVVYLYVCCIVVCCVECLVIEFVFESDVNMYVVIYFNCLFDWFFVVVCVVNNNGKDDVLWVSGVICES